MVKVDMGEGTKTAKKMSKEEKESGRSWAPVILMKRQSMGDGVYGGRH